jgi:hypothetical protein
MLSPAWNPGWRDLLLDRVKCAIKLLWKIISMVSLRHFRIEIKPSGLGLRRDTKTLSGVAKNYVKTLGVLTTF